MCGFVGFYLKNSARLEEERYEIILNKMSKVIDHRGPNDQGVFINKDKKLGLAFQRLSILDLNKNANQPMLSKNKDWIMVYNGEIYNYQELKKLISIQSSFWNTNSDSEIALELISKYGFIKAIPKLNGMFAIAAYCFSTNTLWLARDKFGEKPLYYNYTGTEGLLFGSDIRSFFLYPNIKKSLDKEATAQYFRYGYVPDPLCILKSTHKLEPGSIIKYDQKNLIKKINYWDSMKIYSDIQQKKFNGSFEDAKAELKYRLDISTKNRLRADVPVGIFLSGGIDSSNIALSLARQKKEQKTFSIGFNDLKTNELGYANLIAKNLKTQHYTKIINEKECINEISNIVHAYDEPFSDPSQIPTYLLCKFAKKKITVALSGDGADELFGGYPRYKNILNAWKKIEKFPSFFSNILSNLSESFSCHDNLQLRSLGKKLRKISHKNLDSIYCDELSRWRPDEDLYDKNLLENSYFDISKSSNLLNISNHRYLMLKDIITYLPSSLLVKIDRASMANSLEVRNPFLDDSLVKFTWSLPDKFIYNNEEKIMLKHILSESFSNNIVNRKKQGFEPPLNNWLKGPLKEWACDLINSDDNTLDKNLCAKLLKRFEKGENKLTYKLWTIIMFKAWKKNYMR